MWYYPVIVVILFNLQIIHARVGDRCTTPNGEEAVCQLLDNCRLLLDAVTTTSQRQIQFLQKSLCNKQNNKPVVCCGSDDNYKATERSNLLPPRSTCGLQVENKIWGGNVTDLEEFPWMVLLQYRTSNNSIKTSCGGALISSRYVLTAAHCVTGDIKIKVGKLVNVRLGEHDTSSNPDCISIRGFKECNDPHVNIGVESVVAHPSYNTGFRTNDIALVRLNREVQFTDYIKPLCLPEPNEESGVGANLVVAGWGSTESARISTLKLKVHVPVVSKSNCQRKFTEFSVNIEDTQLCAGGVKGKDSCQGDSGGPLMAQAQNDSSQWYAEGIVSYGAKCGQEGWPAVYTKVTSFLPWIYRNIQ